MVDLQQQRPEYEIELTKVGIQNLRRYIPIRINGETSNILTKINCYINLPSNIRGAHMSRFIEVINETQLENLQFKDIAKVIAKKMEKKHDCPCISEVKCLIPHKRKRPSNFEEEYLVEVILKYSSMLNKGTLSLFHTGILACPCSQELTGGYTHNQRAKLFVELENIDRNFDLFKIIDICNLSFSGQVFSLLKRPEEKILITNIHLNTKFIEDAVRNCVKLLKNEFKNSDCTVRCFSYESIHDHNVFAEWKGCL